MSGSRLIIVSNRLPIVLSRNKGGEWQIESGSGGLVTAMAPVLRNRGGLWIGWPGHVYEAGMNSQPSLEAHNKRIGYILKPVNLSREEIDFYYKGFANQVVWPLFHDFIAYCNFNPKYWDMYKKVNRKFAQTIVENLSGDDFIWVHDYHLMGVASELRKRGMKSKIAFYLHIPFPPPDIFVRLPWRFEILNALLQYDLIGFQTLRERRNFIQCIRTFVQDTRGIGKGQVVSMTMNNREVRMGSFAISIDYNEFAKLAASQEVARKSAAILEDLPDRKIYLGVDRLDYTKGILNRLRAFRNALIRYPDLRENVTLVQVVVPSRRDIPQYADLKIEIERLVGEINGELTRSGWVPVHYIFRSLDRPDLVAYYRAADIAILTPLKDGMNLIAKEYCASNPGNDGVLILSEFAGATAQFQRDALLVNPHDIEGVADAVYQAYQMPTHERKKRMHKLKSNVRKYDIFWWVDSFLQASIAKNLDNFPLVEDYVPTG